MQCIFSRQIVCCTYLRLVINNEKEKKTVVLRCCSFLYCLRRDFASLSDNCRSPHTKKNAVPRKDSSGKCSRKNFSHYVFSLFCSLYFFFSFLLSFLGLVEGKRRALFEKAWCKFGVPISPPVFLKVFFPLLLCLPLLFNHCHYLMNLLCLFQPRRRRDKVYAAGARELSGSFLLSALDAPLADSAHSADAAAAPSPAAGPDPLQVRGATS